MFFSSYCFNKRDYGQQSPSYATEIKYQLLQSDMAKPVMLNKMHMKTEN